MVFPLNRQPPSGPVIDEGPATPCPPLFRTLYVDGQTLVAPADQDGAICSPFSTIQAALDSIPTPPDLSDLADLVQPFELLCAPGIYPEDVVIPTTGYSISIRGNGRSGPAFPISFFAFGAPSTPGASVLISSFGLAPEGSILIEASGSPWDDDPPTAIPSYQFENIFTDTVTLDATAVTEGSNIGLAQVIFERCTVLDLDDAATGFDQKWEGILTVADSQIVSAELPAGGFQAERSLFNDVDCLDMYSADCAIDTAFIDRSGSILSETGLFDTPVLTFLDGGDTLFLDAASHYLAAEKSAMPTSMVRRVTEDNTRAMQATTLLDEAPSTTAFVMANSTNAAILGADVAGRSAVLPLAGSRSKATTSIGPSGQFMGELVFVKSSSLSTGTLTVNPQGGNTIDGGPIALTSPLDGVLLLAVTPGRWTPIARTP
jgi:hypothetical protein